MKIHAKTTQNSKKINPPPLGESYARQWSTWFQNLGVMAAKINQTLPNQFMNASQELLKLSQNHGYQSVLQLSYQAAININFDPISFSLSSARTPRQLVLRWTSCLELQSHNRLIASGKKFSHPKYRAWYNYFIEQISSEEIVIRPFLSPLANMSCFGPAVLGGVACALFDLQAVEIWVHPPNSPSYKLNLQSTLVFNPLLARNFTPDSEILIKGTPLIHLREKNLAAMQDLTHLISDRELLSRITSLPKSQDGGHLPMPFAARHIGISTRSLSRRLTNLNTGYATLIRHIRFRDTCIALTFDEHTIDDIAWYQGYSDRHHLSREFKLLGGFTPSKYRDVLHSNT
ncbi:helix-turn-helix domain-containing protein [Kiloniella antarctica]|uniref:Helix-turn-helix domain-containing protein n=1 Tax=Kiloniella antarctica TaxID=1550907 RepID=A0ABW5BIN6_9PROT